MKKLKKWEYVIIPPILGLILLTSSCISRLVTEHKEARSLPLNNGFFSALCDGTYEGNYAGGRYGWRKNSVSVTIVQGCVQTIQLESSTDPGNSNTDHLALFSRVVENQSLSVDAISGATLTSRAYLKAVENALEKSYNKTSKKEL